MFEGLLLDWSHGIADENSHRQIGFQITGLPFGNRLFLQIAAQQLFVFVLLQLLGVNNNDVLFAGRCRLAGIDAPDFVEISSGLFCSLVLAVVVTERERAGGVELKV